MSPCPGGCGQLGETSAIYALVGTGSHLVATGTFQNADGDARADNVAVFDGSAWHAVGADGAGNGPWIGTGLALALVDRQLYAAGSFTSAGGDPQAHSVASFALSQIIAYPTPTVTAGPPPVPTPTVTAGPPPIPTPPTLTPGPTATPAAGDVKAPATSLRRARLNPAERTATFRFASSEPRSTFACKLDKQPYRPASAARFVRVSARERPLVQSERQRPACEDTRRTRRPAARTSLWIPSRRARPAAARSAASAKHPGNPSIASVTSISGPRVSASVERAASVAGPRLCEFARELPRTLALRRTEAADRHESRRRRHRSGRCACGRVAALARRRSRALRRRRHAGMHARRRT